MSKEDHVQYRHLSVERQSERVVGFVLWYETREAALRLFKLREQVYERNFPNRHVLVEFARDEIDKSYQLYIYFSTGLEDFTTLINGIPTKYIRDIKSYLSEYPYIFMMTGYQDSEGKDRLIPNRFYSTSEVVIDGEIVTGSNSKSYPADLFFDVKSGNIL